MSACPHPNKCKAWSCAKCAPTQSQVVPIRSAAAAPSDGDVERVLLDMTNRAHAAAHAGCAAGWTPKEVLAFVEVFREALGGRAHLLRAAKIAAEVGVACDEHIAMRHMIVQAIRKAAGQTASPDSQRKCDNCEQQTPDGIFCHRCGNRLITSALASTPARSNAEAYRDGLLRGAEIVASWVPQHELNTSISRQIGANMALAIRAEASLPVPPRQDAREDGWRPIASAPNDGTAILLMDGDTDLPVVARWVGNCWRVCWDNEIYTVEDLRGAGSFWQPCPGRPLPLPPVPQESKP